LIAAGADCSKVLLYYSLITHELSPEENSEVAAACGAAIAGVFPGQIKVSDVRDWKRSRELILLCRARAYC
jgi:hypothetical protein